MTNRELYLRSGNVVAFGNGDYGLIVGNNIVLSSGALPVDHYDENTLADPDPDPCFSREIVHVYMIDPSHLKLDLQECVKHMTLVWDRKTYEKDWLYKSTVNGTLRETLEWCEANDTFIPYSKESGNFRWWDSRCGMLFIFTEREGKAPFPMKRVCDLTDQDLVGLTIYYEVYHKPE